MLANSCVYMVALSLLHKGWRNMMLGPRFISAPPPTVGCKPYDKSLRKETELSTLWTMVPNDQRSMTSVAPTVVNQVIIDLHATTHANSVGNHMHLTSPYLSIPERRYPLICDAENYKWNKCNKSQLHVCTNVYNIIVIIFIVGAWISCSMMFFLLYLYYIIPIATNTITSYKTEH